MTSLPTLSKIKVSKIFTKVFLLCFSFCLSNYAFSIEDQGHIGKTLGNALIGNSKAQYRIGEHYYEPGRNQDYSSSFKWFYKAAIQGDAKAQLRVGIMTEKGQGVEPNPQLAFEWVSKSAQQGNPKALFILGTYYEQGLGITKDAHKAQEFYQESCQKGFKKACNKKTIN